MSPLLKEKPGCLRTFSRTLLAWNMRLSSAIPLVGLEERVIQIPLQVTFRNMALSEAIEGHIREKVGGLERFCDKITSCRVIVEAPHRRHHKGKLYHVRVDITVPGSELVVKREPREHAAHEDVYVAIRDAFDAARRELQDYARRRRGQVKLRETPPMARVARLFPEEGYGFLETADGRELYFHRNSVLEPGFDRISVGMEVRFVEEQGEKGPQASTVRIAGGEGRVKTAMPAKAETEGKT